MEIIVNKDGHGVTFGPPSSISLVQSRQTANNGALLIGTYGDGDNGGADLSRDSIAIQIQKWNGFERPFEYNGESFIYVGPFVGESCDHGWRNFEKSRFVSKKHIRFKKAHTSKKHIQRVKIHPPEHRNGVA